MTMQTNSWDEGTAKHCRDWCDTHGVHRADVRGAMRACDADDPEYWGTAGWTRVFEVVATDEYDEFGRANAIFRTDSGREG